VRWCHHCRHFNTGWPNRCRYCSAGLDGRLCARGHVNPLDWQLTYCGDCSAPLQRISGAGFSARPYLIAIAIALVTLVVVSLLLQFGPHAPGLVLTLILFVSLIGGLLAWQVLPPTGRRVLAVIGRILRAIVGVAWRWSTWLFFKRRSRTRKKRRG
jgi:hypothetical protein